MQRNGKLFLYHTGSLSALLPAAPKWPISHYQLLCLLMHAWCPLRGQPGHFPITLPLNSLFRQFGTNSEYGWFGKNHLPAIWMSSIICLAVPVLILKAISFKRVLAALLFSVSPHSMLCFLITDECRDNATSSSFLAVWNALMTFHSKPFNWQKASSATYPDLISHSLKPLEAPLDLCFSKKHMFNYRWNGLHRKCCSIKAVSAYRMHLPGNWWGLSKYQWFISGILILIDWIIMLHLSYLIMHVWLAKNQFSVITEMLDQMWFLNA